VVFYAGQLGLCVALLASIAQASPKQEIVVAAAANLTEAFRALGPVFEAETGVHPVFSFASTAQLTQQIEYAAPFDVFAAADSSHVDELDRKGLLVAGSRAVYAQGVLALWIPPGAKASVKRIEDLTAAEVRVIAMAKPELAPYGEAAVAALRRIGVWDRVKPKVVYAENINMARQYGASNNADAVFTAYSLVQHSGGSVIRVDPALYPPIGQSLGILARSEHLDAARQFVNFLLHGNGRAVLARFGYQLPAPD
jgi:molybdate transport system substrate-binding protein